MLCHTCVGTSFLSKEVSNFNLKPISIFKRKKIMENPQGPGLREKMDLLISAADALKLQLGVVSLVVAAMTAVHQKWQKISDLLHR